VTLVITFKLYLLRKKAFQYIHKNYCPVCPSTKMVPETVLLSVERTERHKYLETKLLLQ